MTKFTQRRFSVSAPISKSYAENYERTFGQKTARCDSCAAEFTCFNGSAPCAKTPLVPPRKIEISRAEVEKWFALLNNVSPAGLATLRESLALVLQADDMDPEKPR